jgi:hypothetical protein
VAKFRTIRNSFLGGMLSRTALGRTDDPRYPHACEVLQNMIPMLSGGAYRRPGTRYSTACAGPSSQGTVPRLIPFVVSKQEAYCISFQYINTALNIQNTRVANQNGSCNFNVANRFTPPGWVEPYTPKNTTTQATSGTPDDPLFEMQFCQSADVMYLVHQDSKPKKLVRIDFDDFNFIDWDSDAASTNVLAGLALAQSFPYLNQSPTGTTITASNTSGAGAAVTLTSSTNIFSPSHVGSIFAIDDGTSKVGFAKVSAFVNGGQVSAVVIAPFGSTAARATWWESAWSNYRGWPRACGLFQGRLVFAGTYFQPDSIWFSETANYQKFSALGDYAPAQSLIVNGAQITTTASYVRFPVDDSEGDAQSTGPSGGQPFRISLNQSTLDQIQWLSPDKELLIGTMSQEWVAAPQNGSFDVANSPCQIQSKYGSDHLQASRIGYELLFALGTQEEVKAYQYNYIDASFFAEPVQLFFDEYPQAETSLYSPGRRKFRWMEWDVTRSTLWCLDTAGNFFGMTRDRKLSTTMWHIHQFGGYDPTKGVNVAPVLSGSPVLTDPAYSICDGKVISFTVIPNAFTGVNDVWLCIKRSGTGATGYYVERIAGKNVLANSVLTGINPNTSQGSPCYVDCAVIQNDNGIAAPGTNYLTYLVGAQLDQYPLVGNYYSETNGMFAITSTVPTDGIGTTVLNQPLPGDVGTAANVVVLGLAFTPIVQPTRLDVGSVIGTSQNAPKKIARLFIRFFKTLSCLVGTPPTGDDGANPPEVLDFSTANQNLSQSNELYTGDKKVYPPTTYDRDGYIYITQADPMPLTVISIVAEGAEYD